MATALNIKDPEAYRLAAEIARVTGKTLTRVVVDALKREKEAVIPPPQAIDLERVHQLLAQLHSMPEANPRSSQELIDDLYDGRGLPK